MKYNFQKGELDKEIDKILNRSNNIRKKRAIILYKITNELNDIYNNDETISSIIKKRQDKKRSKKLFNLQYELMDQFELIHNIKYVDMDYFLDLFIKDYNYYIKNTSKISDMQYDYYESPSYIDFDEINTENDDFIDKL